MEKIKIEIDNKYREHLDLLKQVIPDIDWKQITSDSRVSELLIETFIWFLQEQSNQNNHDHEWWCCWGHHHN